MRSDHRKSELKRHSRAYRVVRYLLIVALLSTGLFVVVEGVCSVAAFGYRFVAYQPLAERRHTEYDELLGWLNKPLQDEPHMYGPDIYLRTNRQRFRNDRDFDAKIPDGKRRIICSGDSFTFGYGVSNDQAWCQLLLADHPNWESVNMAQGGYGFDQAYLWYKRDGAVLEHDVHLFAFITADFERAGAAEFIGYAKPRLIVNHGELQTANVPVPRRRALTPGMDRLNVASDRLNCVRLGKKIGDRLFGGSPPDRSDADPDIRELAAYVIADLKILSDRAGSVLVLVHLPVDTDAGPSDADLWREFLI